MDPFQFSKTIFVQFITYHNVIPDHILKGFTERAPEISFELEFYTKNDLKML